MKCIGAESTCYMTKLLIMYTNLTGRFKSSEVIVRGIFSQADRKNEQ